MFPESPGGYGWVDSQETRHPVESAEALLRRVSDDPDGDVILLWTSEHERMILPECWALAEVAVDEQRGRRLQLAYAAAKRRLVWGLCFGLFAFVAQGGVIWHAEPAGWAWWLRIQHVVASLMASTLVGLLLLGGLMFLLVPWYQSRKEWLEWRDGGCARRGELLPVLQFETWLELQSSPLTRAVALLITCVGLLQWWSEGSIVAAGLVKPAYQAGEWWRLFTAPLLHGNIVHFVMNLLALLVLGKRLEVFAGWPHLLLVFVFSSLMGGVMSAMWLEATSVGASGALMGWLGFLLVFESLHARLVPRNARRRLIAGVVLTAVFGLLGYRFIDNAAHAGGLVAGMLYAWIVFPQSSSLDRPSILGIDRVAGGLAGFVLLAAGLWAAVRMVTHG